MQNPNEDTEWNDVLRAKGILPPKPKEVEIDEDSVVEVKCFKIFSNFFVLTRLVCEHGQLNGLLDTLFGVKINNTV